MYRGEERSGIASDVKSSLSRPRCFSEDRRLWIDFLGNIMFPDSESNKAGSDIAATCFSYRDGERRPVQVSLNTLCASVLSAGGINRELCLASKRRKADSPVSQPSASRLRRQSGVPIWGLEYHAYTPAPVGAKSSSVSFRFLNLESSSGGMRKVSGSKPAAQHSSDLAAYYAAAAASAPIWGAAVHAVMGPAAVHTVLWIRIAPCHLRHALTSARA